MRASTRWGIGLTIVVTTLCLAASGGAEQCTAGGGPSLDGAPPRLRGHGERIAWIAEQYVTRQPRLHREDCSGLVESVLGQSGVLVQGSVRTLWQAALADRRAYRGRAPQPGHLAFFDYTYDANRNGLADDELTHIGIVTAVAADGTIRVVHRPRAGIKPLLLNLDAPATHRREGQLLNDYVRAPGYGGRDSRRLAGQLLYGFAAPPAPVVLDWMCGCPQGAAAAAAGQGS